MTRSQRDHLGTVVLDGEICAIGGRSDDQGVQRRVDICDPAGDQWRDGPLPIVDVHGAGGGTVEGDLLVAGGSRRQGVLTPLAITGVTQRYPAPPAPAP
jgi:hypothetical protein